MQILSEISISCLFFFFFMKVEPPGTQNLGLVSDFTQWASSCINRAEEEAPQELLLALLSGMGDECAIPFGLDIPALCFLVM